MNGISEPLHHFHDPVLVVLSVIIAVFASYIALDLASSVSVSQGRGRLAWLTGGSLAMGVGIWSMHFVGMLAFRLPGYAIAYDVVHLIVSILVAIAASALALVIVSRPRVPRLAYALGSVAMGLAIVGMHYIGIAGMRLSAYYEWDYFLVGASVAIALGASLIALLLAFHLRGDVTRRGFWNRAMGGLVMGGAIAGMHYTAMAAMHFHKGEPVRFSAPHLLASDGLATAVICMSLLIMGIALTGSIVDRALARREAMTAQITKILESVTDGFVSVDREWRIVYINRVAQEIFRAVGEPAIRLGGLKGHVIWEALPSLRGTSFEREYRRAMAGGRMVHVEDFFEPLGRWYEARAYPSNEGLSVYFRDVTEQKRAHETINRAREAAEAATKVKSQFVANVSHEIRTPLGVILGFAELAADPNLAPEERQTYIGGIIRNAKELSQLIGDVLDLSKIEAGKLDIEMGAVALRELLTEVAEAFRYQAQERGVEIVVNAPPPVPETIVTDRMRLRQILVNLIGNAVKFTAKGRIEIAVALRGEDGEKRRLEIDVSDTGIGMTPDQAKGLFMPFSQADSSMTRRYGGTGLGLALSRRLAKAIGGELKLTRSESGKGSVFTLTLQPRAAEEIARRPAPAASIPARGMAGVSLLLVDDSADNRLVVERLLSKIGAKVMTAADGREGVERALSGNYDLVLMDIQMPVMDGFAATAELRKRGYSKPILALTAHAMKEERERAVLTGFDGYVTKPIDRNRLIEAIGKLMPPEEPSSRAGESIS